MNSPLRIYIGSDNLVVVDGIKNVQTGDEITTGTVTCALYNEANMLAGSLVASSSVSFTYSTDQKRWEATIPSTVALAEDASYYLKVTISSSGLDKVVRREVKATYAEGEL